MFYDTRREFLETAAGAVLGTMTANHTVYAAARQGKVETVTGAIDPADLGRTLVHEHILVDFIGADKVSRDRYDAAEVFRIMLPYLQSLKSQGIRTFIDCTPMFLGRDPLLLQRLSRASGIQIVTNTGLYKEPYLPKYAFERSAEELSKDWIREIEEGIEGTGIRAGFIKIAVHREELKPIQQKIVHAACLTHRATGAAFACHSGHGPAMMQILDIAREEKIPPGAFIAVHAGSEKDRTYHYRLVEAGAWVEYDNIGSAPVSDSISAIRDMLDRGFEDRLLLSMDRGWYHVGEAKGGTVKPFDYFVAEFIPAMLQAGISQKRIDRLTIENPAKAFRLTKKRS